MNTFMKQLICGGSILCVLLVGCAAGGRTTSREELPAISNDPTAVHCNIPDGLLQ